MFCTGHRKPGKILTGWGCHLSTQTPCPFKNLEPMVTISRLLGLPDWERTSHFPWLPEGIQSFCWPEVFLEAVEYVLSVIRTRALGVYVPMVQLVLGWGLNFKNGWCVWSCDSWCSEHGCGWLLRSSPAFWLEALPVWQVNVCVAVQLIQALFGGLSLCWWGHCWEGWSFGPSDPLLKASQPQQGRKDTLPGKFGPSFFLMSPAFL